jgi:aryl-alcohol dehydrogenase-like predicted oxidoreductase
VAEQQNATPAQVALAWIMTRPGLTAPIASATSAEQMRELLHAMNLRLEQTDMEQLNQASE